jgi:PAS domain S-box-containing protein
MYPSDSTACLDQLRDVLDQCSDRYVAQSVHHALSVLEATFTKLKEELQQERSARLQAEFALNNCYIEQDHCIYEAALQESEAQYLRLIETASEGIWILDAADKTSFANGRLAQLLGYTQKELMEKSLLNVVHPDCQLLAQQSLERLRQGYQEHQDLKFQGKNGKESWAILSAAPIFSPHGAYTGILAMITDITERKTTRDELEQSLCLLQTILESTADGILAIDRFGTILTINQQCRQQWNLGEVELKSDREFLELVISQLKQPDQFRQQLQTEYDQPNLEGHYSVELSDGRVLDRYSKPLRLGETMIGRVISYRDITEQRRAQADLEVRVTDRTAELRAANETLQREVAQRELIERDLRLFESVVVNGNDAVLITDANLDQPKITFANAAFTQSTGYPLEEILGKTPHLLQGAKTDRAQLNRIRAALEEGRSIQVELINYRKDGSEFWVDLNIVPIVDANGTIAHFVAMQRDITDRKWSEKALLATQARLKYLLSSNPSVIYTCQPNRNRACTFVSENITQQLGYEIWQYLKDPHFWMDHIHPEDVSIVLDHLMRLPEKDEATCEYRFLHQDGSYRWLRDGMKLLRDRHGNPVEIIGSVVNISDRKWAETQIRKSLQEKEVMLKEIHHRVKNNLQVISSLLKLQAGYIKDDRILEVFKESQNRVRAMALIHEKLYQSEDLARTDFAEYIRSLVHDLFRSYSINSRAVQLTLNVEDVRLSIDTAIPCGLIINELVSNSLKYAFPDRKSGEIKICLQSQENDYYQLTVQDSGGGFPENFDFRNTKSLGLQLVCNLTKQLHGEIQLDCESGSKFSISFAEQKPRV